MENVKVTVYTHMNCIYCVKQKEWMLENNIKFEEKDISVQEHYAEFLEKKILGTPHTIIDFNGEEQSVLGFNRDKLESIFKI